MLREIIAITGRPGLFKLISHGKQTLIVEEIGSGRRSPATARDKVVSLGDIAMYTESGDTPLGEILDMVYAKHEGKPIDVKPLASTKGALKEEFAAIVEDFDRDRVHDSDIKKLFTWYNILLGAGFTKFAEEEETEEPQEETKPEVKEETKPEVKEEKPAEKETKKAKPAKKVAKEEKPAEKKEKKPAKKTTKKTEKKEKPTE